MKYTVFSMLACVVAIEAKPKPYVGYGNGMIDLGPAGARMGGLRLGNRRTNPLAMDELGYGTSGSEFSRGSGFGDSGFSSGASGLDSRGFHNGGRRNFHDIGQHHSSRTSINHAENTDNHDIGGSEFFDTGAQSGTGFNQYGNGFNKYGNDYGSGRQMTSFL
ncbi:heterogeneous nuclear ribonucleoprotein A3 homolog 2-like [Danaus plexippus]|uniref:heterogeneous nuclear ribonucleoprotein A3 homolog 2-like n=1 Tax=Danaus plexippus TaxID=13037 RepID=UPI002AB02382|nr:heterogeneous nuclear ribonucleoprotein A3 homolog 2-like [Danaus plexippus]XP_061380393.1 heterogeneous nuclear ribonucleoprotein A3 homolog 2-like [Danaus plexippus]XP_061380402.1 heterogeneous nuclear ribonucleoprotein A3 homolog 2-like [Danaus plexippus]